MEPNLSRAAKVAREVLDDLEISSIEQLRDLDGVCLGRGVFVRPEPLRSFDGLLIRHRRMIVYREDLASPGRQRFTVAHELGHWELHPNVDQSRACTSGDISAYRGSAQELEANAFAAEILMPERFLVGDLRYLSPTIDAVRRLSDRYQTSITAAAVRLAQFTDLPVFVAFSAADRLKWYVRSRKATPYFFKRIGSALHDESLAWDCAETLDDLTEPQEVDNEAWFPEDRDRHGFKAMEESVELGDLGITLSIITVVE